MKVMDNVVDVFTEKLSTGPEYVAVCHRHLFRHQVLRYLRKSEVVASVAIIIIIIIIYFICNALFIQKNLTCVCVCISACVCVRARER